MSCVVCLDERDALLEKIEQRSRDDVESTNETTIVPRKPEELSDLLGVLWGCPLLDRTDLAGFHGHALLADDVAQV